MWRNLILEEGMRIVPWVLERLVVGALQAQPKMGAGPAGGPEFAGHAGSDQDVSIKNGHEVGTGNADQAGGLAGIKLTSEVVVTDELFGARRMPMHLAGQVPQSARCHVQILAAVDDFYFVGLIGTKAEHQSAAA